MALPVNFATLQAGNEALSLLDTQFAAVAALGVIPCAAAGQNSITLTPNANTPTVSGYTDLSPSFSFAAAQTSNSAVTINVAGIGARNAYRNNGQTACGAGDLVAGCVYKATFLTALNSGAGGFVVDVIPVEAAIQFVIDGGGNPIATGNKGTLYIPYACIINAWQVIADQSGSIAIDILRGANLTIPVASIVGGGTKPNLTAQQVQAQTPGGWTSVTLAQDDFISFNVTSAATVTRVTVCLRVVH
jgi:hypothetical protein